MYNTWLLGDGFLREAFGSFQAMNSEAKIKKKPPPYIFDYFNVIPLYQRALRQISSMEARMENALVSMLNVKDHLPTYLLIIPDKDLLRSYSFFAFGISKIIQRCLSHMMNDIKKDLRTRREDLMQKRPGAVSERVKVIWVKVVNRPYIRVPNPKQNIFTQIAKFNFILEDLLADRGGNIMEIKHLKDSFRPIW